MDGLFVAPCEETHSLQELVLHLHGGERHVPLQRLVQQQTHAAPILGHEGQLGVQALPGAVQRDRLAVELHGAARLVQAHHTVGNTQLALAGQTADAQDLALLHVQIHVADDLAGHIHPQLADGHNGAGIGVVADVVGSAAGSHLAPHHVVGDVADVRLAGGHVLDHITVPHDDHLIAHRQDLLQAVGDEDHGDAPGGHAADGVQQRLRLLLGEHGGGFVQDQQLQVLLAQLAGDLRKLLVPHGHAADDHLLVDSHAHLLDGFCGAVIHFLIVESVQARAEHF